MRYRPPDARRRHFAEHRRRDADAGGWRVAGLAGECEVTQHRKAHRLLGVSAGFLQHFGQLGGRGCGRSKAAAKGG